jgi:hypothetical protein
MTTTTTAREPLTVFPFFTGQRHAEPESADSIRATVDAWIGHGYRRVAGKTASRRYKLGKQSRFVLRMRHSTGRNIINLVFAMGEVAG